MPCTYALKDTTQTPGTLHQATELSDTLSTDRSDMKTKESILIVDDDESVSKSLSLVLEKKGYETQSAGTGKEALEKAREASFNVALVDIKLPDVEGMELISLLKEAHPDMSLMIVTGYGSLSSSVQALDKGVAAYLTKPLNMDVVLQRVEDILEKQQLMWEKWQAEKALQAEKDKFEGIISSLAEGLDIVSQDYRIHFQNKMLRDRFGDLTGKLCYEEYMGRQTPCESCPMVKAIATGHTQRMEMIGADDRNYEVTSTPFQDIAGETKVIEVVRDITERRQAEEALRESENKYRTLMEEAPIGICHVDIKGKITYVNNTILQGTGYSSEELIGKNAFRLGLIPHETLKLLGRRMKEKLMGKPPSPLEIQFKRKDGKWIWLEIRGRLLSQHGVPVGVQIIGEDITERKRTEEALKDSEGRYRGLFENSSEFLFTLDLKGNFSNVNKAAVELTGYTKAELLKMNFKDYTPRSNHRKLFRAFYNVFKTGKSLKDFPVKAIVKGKTEKYFEISLSPLKKGDEIIGFQGSSKDLTERVQAEVEVRQLSQYLESIIDNADVWLNVLDKEGNVLLWNKAAEAISGFTREEVIGHNKIWEWNYPDPAYRSEIEGQTKEIIESGKVLEGFETTIHCKGGQTKIMSWNERRLSDEKRDPIGSISLGRDVTEQKQAQEKLQKALEGTIQAVGMTTEQRDPYTAGHQRRVTQLACAIAREMGLSEEQVESIRIAGLMHDIGKMSIPAEILSKPSKLSDMEFRLIQDHPQVAYDILKTIEFPWPIAQIVLQHHERMDGSGYPQGLKGEEIVQEARILAVADVVEAMASHRPYRPAHGIEKALEEISRNQGTLYDSDVANACLRLFAEERFEFQE